MDRNVSPTKHTTHACRVNENVKTIAHCSSCTVATASFLRVCFSSQRLGRAEGDGGMSSKIYYVRIDKYIYVYKRIRVYVHVFLSGFFLFPLF